MGDGEEKQKWHFPGSPAADIPAHASSDKPDEPEVSWQPLCIVPGDKAQLTSKKLEEHGIPCTLRESSRPTQADDDSHQMDILVSEEHLDAALAVLNGEIEEDEPEDEAELEERRIANFICPKCNKGRLELLPFTQAWKIYRRISLGLFIFGLLEATLLGLMRLDIPDWAVAIPLVAGFFLSISLGFVPRQTRCKECKSQFTRKAFA